MNEDPRPRGTDPILLTEVGLVLLLFALFIYLYFLPAGERTLFPAWWASPLLILLFFGILLLERWRRSNRARSGPSQLLFDQDPDGPEERREQ